MGGSIKVGPWDGIINLFILNNSYSRSIITLRIKGENTDLVYHDHFRERGSLLKDEFITFNPNNPQNDQREGLKIYVIGVRDTRVKRNIYRLSLPYTPMI
jgi:hypothetical protein